MIECGGWLELSLPAIATDDHAVPVGPHELHHRKADSILHPERESGKTLERIKAEIGSLQFSAQYQQSPVPPEGNLIRRDWLKTYDTAPTRAPGVRIVQSWDIATTTDERNDWSVCTTWAIRQKKSSISSMSGAPGSSSLRSGARSSTTHSLTRHRPC